MRRALALLLAWIPAIAPALAASDRPVDPALPAFVPQRVTLPAGARYVLPDGAIRISGAEHAEVMVAGFNALFERNHPGFKFAVSLKGTSTGMPLLTHGVTLFAPLGREALGVELVPYGKIVGQDPIQIRVAHDSNVPGKFATNLAIYVNAANPLSHLTMEQLARVFGRGHPRGDLSTWGQLGLTGEWASRRIHLFVTPEASGFGDYTQRHVVGGRQLAASADQRNNTEELIQSVAADRDGLCLAAIGVKTPGIKQIALASTDAGPWSLGSIEDITANRYPLGRHLYFYVRRVPGQPVDPVVREYFRLILSREGQAIIAAEPDGYIPLTAADAAAELAKLD